LWAYSSFVGLFFLCGPILPLWAYSSFVGLCCGAQARSNITAVDNPHEHHDFGITCLDLSSLFQWLSSKTNPSWMYSQLLCVHKTCGRKCHLVAGPVQWFQKTPWRFIGNTIHVMTEGTISCTFLELSFCLPSQAIAITIKDNGFCLQTPHYDCCR